MADITWKNVESMAPELCTFDKGGQAMLLKFVNSALRVESFGGESSPKLRLARIYLAAHYATMANQGNQTAASGASGAITREKVGDLEREYSEGGADLASAEGLKMTAYGLLLQDLMNWTTTRGPQVL